jgi:hypothetical protein
MNTSELLATIDAELEGSRSLQARRRLEALLPTTDDDERAGDWWVRSFKMKGHEVDFQREEVGAQDPWSNEDRRQCRCYDCEAYLQFCNIGKEDLPFDPHLDSDSITHMNIDALAYQFAFLGEDHCMIESGWGGQAVKISGFVENSLEQRKQEDFWYAFTEEQTDKFRRLWRKYQEAILGW